MKDQQLLPLLAERITTDPALAQRAAKVTNAEELAAFAQAEGAALSLEEAAQLLPQFLTLCANGDKLPDDMLDGVAGGGMGGMDGVAEGGQGRITRAFIEEHLKRK